MKKTAIAALGMLLALLLCGSAWGEGKIIHDAEFQLLQEQYGKKWAGLSNRLRAALKAK